MQMKISKDVHWGDGVFPHDHIGITISIITILPTSGTAQARGEVAKIRNLEEGEAGCDVRMTEQ